MRVRRQKGELAACGRCVERDSERGRFDREDGAKAIPGRGEAQGAFGHRQRLKEKSLGKWFGLTRGRGQDQHLIRHQ